MNDSFFGKSGTLQSLKNFAEAYSKNKDAQNAVSSVSGLKSNSGVDRLGSLVKLVGSIVLMCA